MLSSERSIRPAAGYCTYGSRTVVTTLPTLGTASGYIHDRGQVLPLVLRRMEEVEQRGRYPFRGKQRDATRTDRGHTRSRLSAA